MANSLEIIKKLREATGAGVMDVKRALTEADDDIQKAKEIILNKGFARAEKRVEREAASGLIHAYVHGSGEVGVILELNCETSFVAQTDEYAALAHEICLQIAAMAPATVDELLVMDYIRDTKKKITDLVKELIAKTGENIVIRRFNRYQIGE